MDLTEEATQMAADLDVDAETIREDLESLRSYSVPMDEARQTIRRKYGRSDTEPSSPSKTDIDDIEPGVSAISIVGRILTAGRRTIRIDGEDREIIEGSIADDSGKISYTAWVDVPFTAGDTVEISNASVREFQGEAEININENTAIEETDADVAGDIDIGGPSNLIDLSPGDRGCTVTVEILEVETRTIDGRDGKTDIKSGVIGDASGRLPFTDWENRAAIQPGETVRLDNVYIRTFRGVPSVNCSEHTTVEVLDTTIDVESSAQELTIHEARASGGLFDVVVSGAVVDIRNGSGLIERCPECDRVIQRGTCREHGDVDGESDLRTKAILDDGTGTVTVVLDRDMTETWYGGSLDAAREAAREAMDQSVVEDELAAVLLGRYFRVRGHLSIDEYGATLEATTFEESDHDPATRASTIFEEAHQ